VSNYRFSDFTNNIGRARDLIGLGQSIGSMTVGRVDGSDLFRAAITQSVAAMDSFFHGVVLDRAVHIVMGRVVSTSPTSAKIGLSIGALLEILACSSPPDREIAARTHIAARLALETFQRPDDISAALALVGVRKIWSTAFSDPATAKNNLGLVVTRRNRIVHGCDSDPLVPGTPTPITAADAVAAIDTVRTTVEAIEPHCR
jgi:hypothetical protein